MRVAIISCASKKADHKCSAYEMYSVSNTFKTQADLASMMYDEYFIMSAKYGIISPNKEIEPYNLTLHTKRLTSGILITEGQKTELKSKIKKQIQYLLDEGYKIDFHLSTDYYNLLSPSHQNHSKITHIKPQKLQSVTVQLYKEGIEKFQDGDSLDEVVYYLSNTVKTGNEDRESEQPGWWYHPIENPFWGRSHELAKKHRLNDGNLFMHYHQDTVQSKHVMGWTNNLDNLKQLKQTSSGSWRICGKNDIPYVTDFRLQEITQFIQNNPPQTKPTLSDIIDSGQLEETKVKSKPSFLSKNTLQSIISKYYLGGKVESVKWVVEDKKLHIDFMAPTKDMIGRLSCNNFPLSEDGTLAIFNTTQLNRLLNVLAGDLMLDAERTKAILTKLTIQDAKSTINYSLADPLMIQKVGEVDEDIEWKVQATLENEDFHTFVRAASAIQGNEIVTLSASRDTVDTPIVKFIFGERMEFSNKVEFHVNAKFGDEVREDNKIPFNSEMLREIFNANKTSDECHLSFVDDGLLRLIFTSEDEGIDTTYFVVRKADY